MTQRELDKMLTKAAYWAGYTATGCRTRYEMDLRFGTPHDDPTSRSDSSDRKNRVWEGWAAGQLPIPKLQAKNDERLCHRLACIRHETDKVDQVLGMALWRNLEPQPLNTLEMDLGRCLNPWLISAWNWPLPERKLTLNFLDSVWMNLQQQHHRHTAIEAIWMLLRCSHHWLDIAQYGLCYMIWRGARQLVGADPVFGKIAGGIYEHTQQHFCRVRFTDERYFNKAVQRLQGAALQPIVDLEAKTALVPLRHLVSVLELARRETEPGDDPD